MVTSIVSVRMPSSLVQRLRELAKENHFLDVSEEVRSIIKAQISSYRLRIDQMPASEEQVEPAQKPGSKTQDKVKEELVRRLKKMIKELENE